jgi:hypothetical protein
MHTNHWRRALAIASLLLATACGGHTDPSGPADDGGNDKGAVIGAYDLAAIGKVALGNELQIETCIPVRFTGGVMNVYENGAWDFTVQVATQNGNGQFRDWGTYEQAGTALWFASEPYGDNFEGTFDGAEVKLDYDFCPNGETDIQLVFDK